MSQSAIVFISLIRWSHPPGSNRRPPDYETFRSSQIADNTVHRESFGPAREPIVALIEQVSEQVAAPIPFLTTAVLRRLPAAPVSEDTHGDSHPHVFLAGRPGECQTRNVPPLAPQGIPPLLPQEVTAAWQTSPAQRPPKPHPRDRCRESDPGDEERVAKN